MLPWVRENISLLFLLIDFKCQKGRFKYTAMLFIN